MARFLLKRLGLAAITLVLLSVPLSIIGGVAAALRQGRITDRTITVGGLSLTAVPEFVTAIVLIVIFGVVFHLLPTTAQAPPGAGFFTQVKFLLLPSFALVAVLFGYIARIARAGVIEALDADYTRTAYLKGLDTPTVIRRHVLRNALLPTIAVVATQTGYAIAGSPLTAQDPLNPSAGILARPGGAHWLGTDTLGRDVFSRVLAGATSVMKVAPLATLLGVAAGTVLGLVMGYSRGFVDDVLGRVIDAVLALPLIVLAVTAIVALG